MTAANVTSITKPERLVLDEHAQLMQQIISRYETEEDEFLRELDLMRKQCTIADGNNFETETALEDLHIEQQQSPVLGTLCHLVSEIGELRRENKKLQSRLASSRSNSNKKFGFAQPNSNLPKNSTTITTTRNVVHRVNAFLDRSNRLSTLSRLIGSNNNNNCPMMSSGSSSGIFNNLRSNSALMEVKQGAKERLSSPPPLRQFNQKESLIVSSYSADLSSDFSCRNRGAPPLVLPETEMSDSESENNVFQEIALPIYQRSEGLENGNPLKGRQPTDPNINGSDIESRSRRSLTRRSHFSSISEHTSPSSFSSSSAEPNDHMVSSRGSFLELLGLRARRWTPGRLREKTSQQSYQQQLNNALLKTPLKKRKRKISESDQQKCESKNETQSYSEHFSRSQNINNNCKINKNDSKSTDSQWNAEDKKKVNKWRTHSSERPLKIGVPIKEAINGRNEKDNLNRYDSENVLINSRHEKKLRPRSMVYLKPSASNYSNESSFLRVKSCKSVTNSNQSSDSFCGSCGDNSFNFANETFERLRAENSLLRNELQLLKTRNNRLIDQLREKSMHFSLLQTQKSQLEEQMNSLRRNEQFNGLVDRLCLRSRFTKNFEIAFSKLEEKLHNYESEIQTIKTEAYRNQQMALKSTLIEQNAYQNCLEQVERLQRENFSLLQMRISEMNCEEIASLRQRLDLLPSYDALYSFTMGILNQMRNIILEKSNQISQFELELMHAQSTLLLTHAQVERLRLQFLIKSKITIQRRHSYHGSDIIEQYANRELCFLLPFRLHGARIQQQSKYHASAASLDEKVDSNEHNIEMEFLRLFDYARCLSRIYEDGNMNPLTRLPINHSSKVADPVIVYRNGRGTVSPMNSPLMNEARKNFCKINSKLSPKNRNNSPTQTNKDSQKSSKTQILTGKRPFSWLEVGAKDSPSRNMFGVINFRKFDDEFDFAASSPQNSTPNSSPLLGMHKLGHLFRNNRFNNHQRTFGASLHDICRKSPSTTPILTRRIPLLGSSPPNQITEQRLIKQTSLQLKQEYAHHPPFYDSPPLGDCQRRNNSHLQQQQKRNVATFSEDSSNSSADYNTINSAGLSLINGPTKQNSRQFGANYSRGNPSNNLERSREADRQMPTPSAPPLSLMSSAHNGMTVVGSRLPQITNSNVSGILYKQRHSGPGLPSNAQNTGQMRNPLTNVSKPTSPSLSNASPRTNRLFPQQPQIAVQQSHQVHSHFQKQTSNQGNISETSHSFGAHRFPNSPPSIETTTKLHSPPSDLLEVISGGSQEEPQQTQNGSKLPKPASPAKKAVNLWLSRLKINNHNRNSTRKT